MNGLKTMLKESYNTIGLQYVYNREYNRFSDVSW